MTLFMDGNDYALFASPDLKSWTHLQDLTLPGVSECPDFFELPVDGDPSNTRWVFWGASGGYLLGRFDGNEFRPETDVLQAEQGANGYAAQTWSDVPADDGRRIQISWMRGGRYPAMPFNQQMSFPVELTLRTLPDGIRLCREPVREIELLHTGTRTWPAGDLAAMAAEQFQQRYASGEISSYAVTDLREAESRLVLADEGDLFDVRMAIEVGDRDRESAGRNGFTIEVQGHTVEYDAEAAGVVLPGADRGSKYLRRPRQPPVVDRPHLAGDLRQPGRGVHVFLLPAGLGQSPAGTEGGRRKRARRMRARRRAHRLTRVYTNSGPRGNTRNSPMNDAQSPSCPAR